MIAELRERAGVVNPELRELGGTRSDCRIKGRGVIAGVGLSLDFGSIGM